METSLVSNTAAMYNSYRDSRVSVRLEASLFFVQLLCAIHIEKTKTTMTTNKNAMTSINTCKKAIEKQKKHKDIHKNNIKNKQNTMTFNKNQRKQMKNQRNTRTFAKTTMTTKTNTMTSIKNTRKPSKNQRNTRTFTKTILKTNKTQ